MFLCFVFVYYADRVSLVKVSFLVVLLSMIKKIIGDFRPCAGEGYYVVYICPLFRSIFKEL